MAKYFTKEGDEFKEVSDNLLTQSEVDNVVESRLERQKKQFADYDELKEKAGRVDTVTKEFNDKLKAKDGEIDTLKGDLGKSKLETTKVRLINEFKLTDDLAEFVTGETEDEMRGRAEKLSKGIGKGGVRVPKEPKPNEKASSSKEIASKLFGSKKSDD